MTQTESTARDCGHGKFVKAATFSVHMVHIAFGFFEGDMDGIAKALVLAVRYIDQQSNLHAEDDDVNALEEIATALAVASTTEQDAFARMATSLGFPELVEQLGLDSPR
ncbi:hypothetical protein [Burkholderia cepacia]|nr:hypothetical protein [Burkholderia cepacia]